MTFPYESKELQVKNTMGLLTISRDIIQYEQALLLNFHLFAYKNDPQIPQEQVCTAFTFPSKQTGACHVTLYQRTQLES